MSAKKKFVLGTSPVSGSKMLIIEDLTWWVTNQAEIIKWMKESLPRGFDHLQGAVITFDNEEQRNWFLLRWT